jgi:metal-responsive CopG/Arc/MetJ family transcriptional regulator
MKIAVSIPDPVFTEAEHLARRLGTTRSDLYARALRAFVGAYSPDPVTAAMNRTLDAIADIDPADDDADDFTRQAARRVLKSAEW